MAESTNNDLLTGLIGTLKLRATDISKFKVSKTIIPTIETNPHSVNKEVITRGQAIASSAATATIYTTPVDRDFYLQTVQLSFCKDAACDIASGNYGVYAVISGSNRRICYLSRLTLSAATGAVCVPLPKAIKVDRNSNITLEGGTFTAGSSLCHASITGYHE